MVDTVIYTLEKEDVPYWNKFLQGYYDASGVSSDSFDQAIRMDGNGEPDLTAEMRSRGIQLSTAARPSLNYMGFNMLDPVVGGASDNARKLRQALSIALPQGKKGLNDDGREADMKSIEKKVRLFRSQMIPDTEAYQTGLSEINRPAAQISANTDPASTDDS